MLNGCHWEKCIPSLCKAFIYIVNCLCFYFSWVEPMAWPIPAQGHTNVGFITKAMNEDNTLINSSIIVLRKNGYFMVMFLCHMYDLHFIAIAVVVSGGFCVSNWGV